MRWFYLPLNPEPWAIGPVGYARRNGKMSAYVGRNQQLDAYKEAVREALKTLFPDEPMYEGEFTLKFYFWRNRADYTTPQARTARKHDADGTNMAKATEDALQGVLFKNDKDVRRMTWEVIEQGPDALPAVVVGIEPYVELPLPEAVVQMMDQAQTALPFDEDEARWSPSDEEAPF